MFALSRKPIAYLTLIFTAALMIGLGAVSLPWYLDLPIIFLGGLVMGRAFRTLQDWSRQAGDAE